LILKLIHALMFSLFALRQGWVRHPLLLDIGKWSQLCKQTNINTKS